MADFAHSKNDKGVKHALIDHLRDVAALAGEFAAATRGKHGRLAELARWAGWLHDLGKYRAEFQEYLDDRRVKSRETRHAVHGAAAALTNSPPLPAAIGFAVSGHHSGLDDIANLKAKIQEPEAAAIPQAKRLLERLRAEVGANLPAPVPEFFARSMRTGHDLSDEFLIRMLFSCLVDADYLDTEQHFQGRIRQPIPLDPGALLGRVVANVGELERRHAGDHSVRRLRRRIFDESLAAADSPTGLFSLTTPTGGGKTLASLAFALKHAEVNDLRRVVVVIPFLSIIEQTARTYRAVLGAANVVEHHSAAVHEKLANHRGERERSPSELATENWDAPVVVTTAVQLLESLFARSPSRCRKLHNLARSVIVFDEVQTRPHHLLDPTPNVIRELAKNYGASFVFCSATQPGFRRHGQGLPNGFQPDEVREIASDS